MRSALKSIMKTTYYSSLFVFCPMGIQIYCSRCEIYCSLAGSRRVLLLFQNHHFTTTHP